MDHFTWCSQVHLSAPQIKVLPQLQFGSGALAGSFPHRTFQFSLLSLRHSTTILDFFAYYQLLTKVNGNSQWLYVEWRRHTS